MSVAIAGLRLTADALARGANASPESVPLVRLLPATSTVGVGDAFTVAVQVEDVRDLYGVELRLSFDPGMLQVQDADPSASGIQVIAGTAPYPDDVAKNEANNTAGTVWYAASQMNPRPPFTGTGTTLSVTFLALQEGASAADITSHMLATVDADLIPHNVSGCWVYILPKGVTPSPTATATPTVTPSPTATLAAPRPSATPTVVKWLYGPGSLWIRAFGLCAGGWTSQDRYPRLVADVNGDGRADVVGFSKYGTYVSLSTGTSFLPATRWIANYGTVVGGWTSQDLYPRAVADVNKDGRADIVGFGNAGVFVSLATTNNTFAPPTRWIAAFGAGAAAGGWTSQNLYPRMLADTNADGKADIVGFGNGGVLVSTSTGSAFAPAVLGIPGYGRAAGWSSQNVNPRTVADVNGDRKADIIGFSNAGPYVSLRSP
jgi:hypothetical protein